MIFHVLVNSLRIGSSGSSDFIGINFYTSDLVTAKKSPTFPSGFIADQDIVFGKNPNWLG